MVAPLIKLGALRLGCEFETALTKRHGIVIEKVRSDSPGIVCAFSDTDLTINLHEQVLVRPLALREEQVSEEESIH